MAKVPDVRLEAGLSGIRVAVSIGKCVLPDAQSSRKQGTEASRVSFC